MEDNTFELNGERYAPIEINKAKNSSTSRKMLNILGMSSMMMPYVDFVGMGSVSRTRELPKGIDIIVEYGLIQKKQSTLSRWEREMVVSIFESKFKKLIKLSLIHI